MRQSRREFLSALSAAGMALGLSRFGSPALAWAQGKATSPLRILVLGGTRFLGPAIVDHALARGHELTLFNRGKSNPHLYPELEKLVGDRDGDLEALKGRDWDAVIDTSGYVPRIVTDSAQLLKDHVKQYVFISTKSVYPSLPEPDLDESHPVGKLEDESVEEITGETYGPLKALCEQAAESVMPGRVSNIRPGLIVGPRDRSDRFTYWPVRIARGGEVLAPGEGLDYVQYIDVRDLAEFIVRCLEEQTVGVFNTVTPAGPTMQDLLVGCRAAVGGEASFTWADAAFLEENQVSAYRDMPCWVPQDGEYLGFARIRSDKAVAAGLGYRTLATTAWDTLKWWQSEPAERREAPMKAGLTPEREAELLEMWHSRVQRG